MRRFVLIALLLVAPLAVTEEPPAQLEQLEQQEAFDQVFESLDRAEGALDSLMRTRKLKCLKAFGNETFCECLNEKLAVGLDFDGYIMAVTRTKDELKYDTLSKDDRSLVDIAIKTRNACVE